MQIIMLDKLGGCGRKGIKMVGMMGVGTLILWMGWHPARLPVRLPLWIFFLHYKTQKMACITHEHPHMSG